MSDFAAGQTITIDIGVALETALIATVGTPGSTMVRTATDVGSTVIPVASAIGFSAGQTVTIDSDTNHEMAVVAAVAGGRGGFSITVAEPLARAHSAGAQLSGSGITLTAPLTKAHVSGAQAVVNLPTPGAPNQYYRRPR